MDNPLFKVNEPHRSFHHAAAKTEWASRLINYLNGELTAFIDNNEFPVTLQRSPETGISALYVATPNGWPISIPCALGDVCHNLRSALDICYMGVVRSVRGIDAEKRTMPIESNEKGLVSTLSKIFEDETLVKIQDALVSRMNSHRDFAAGGNVRIAALNKLSNWQKHNLLVPLIGVTEIPGPIRMYSPSTGAIVTSDGAISLKNSYGNIFTLAGDDAELSYDGKPTFEITLDVPELGGGNPIIPTLLDFMEATVEGIQAFCETWPSEGNPTFA